MEQVISNLEADFLARILLNKLEGKKFHPEAYPMKAFIVWQDTNGRIQMGPCRWGHRNNYITNEGQFDTWSVSPFPGGWTDIILEQIICVRSIEEF